MREGEQVISLAALNRRDVVSLEVLPMDFNSGTTYSCACSRNRHKAMLTRCPAPGV
jgi:hypothetical protein